MTIEFKLTHRGYRHGLVAGHGDKKVEILRYDACHTQWEVFCYVNQVLQPHPDDTANSYMLPVAKQVATAFLEGNAL